MRTGSCFACARCCLSCPVLNACLECLSTHWVSEKGHFNSFVGQVLVRTVTNKEIHTHIHIYNLGKNQSLDLGQNQISKNTRGKKNSGAMEMFLTDTQGN